MSTDVAEAGPGPAPASRIEELVYLFFTTWTLVGLCLDGWAHRTRPELESFFTPWHAVFYSGYVGGAATLALIVIRRRARSASLFSAIPDGYQLAVVGLGVFAFGAVGDGIWHTVFGIETSVDALLSPTHLIMLVSMLGATTSPVRAAWRNPASPTTPRSFGAFVPVALSTMIATTAVSFFFLYANGFNNWLMQFEYEPITNDITASLGVLSTLSTTLILIGSAMILLRRWRPPFGTFLFIFGGIGVFMAGLDGFAYSWQIVAPVVGGLVFDVVLATTRTSFRQTGSNRSAALIAGVFVPLIMWSVSILATHLAWTVGWPPELWAGSVVMAMLAGFGVSLIAFPPATPQTIVGGP